MEKNKSTEVLGVRIDIFTIQDINNLIMQKATSPYSKPIVIFKPYVEFLSLASKNSDIKRTLNESDYNIADSTAVQWGASYLHGHSKSRGGIISAYFSLLFKMRSSKWRTQIIPERMAGVDQTKPLLQLANKKHLRVGIVGGPKDIEETRNRLQRMFKNINLDVWSGYYRDSEEQDLVTSVASKNLDILFVAMGFPRQEKFCIKYKDKLHAKVIIGEGGSFDYDQLGGKIKRAPGWMKKAGLEWLWRLMRQPKRLRRQFAIPSYIFKVAREKKYQK